MISFLKMKKEIIKDARVARSESASLIKRMREGTSRTARLVIKGMIMGKSKIFSLILLTFA
jgi:hypothetical protein